MSLRCTNSEKPTMSVDLFSFPGLWLHNGTDVLRLRSHLSYDARRAFLALLIPQNLIFLLGFATHVLVGFSCRVPLPPLMCTPVTCPSGAGNVLLLCLALFPRRKHYLLDMRFPPWQWALLVLGTYPGTCRCCLQVTSLSVINKKSSNNDFCCWA